MIGLNAVFGLTSAFLNSYVNGEVVPVALNDPETKYNGVLNSLTPAVAAAMSLLFGRVSPIIGRGPVLIFGACCFFGVVFPFLVEPQAQNWGWAALIMVYSIHGAGRATFEGTLKATFADYFSYEKEGAFANIILQNGLSGAVGHVSEY
jgi:MFS family permease